MSVFMSVLCSECRLIPSTEENMPSLHYRVHNYKFLIGQKSNAIDIRINYYHTDS